MDKALGKVSMGAETPKDDYFEEVVVHPKIDKEPSDKRKLVVKENSIELKDLAKGMIMEPKAKKTSMRDNLEEVLRKKGTLDDMRK